MNLKRFREVAFISQRIEFDCAVTILRYLNVSHIVISPISIAF